MYNTLCFQGHAGACISPSLWDDCQFQCSKHELKCLGYLQYKCPLPEISFMWEGENELWKQSVENVDDNRMWERCHRKIVEKCRSTLKSFIYSRVLKCSWYCLYRKLRYINFPEGSRGRWVTWRRTVKKLCVRTGQEATRLSIQLTLCL